MKRQAKSAEYLEVRRARKSDSSTATIRLRVTIVLETTIYCSDYSNLDLLSDDSALKERVVPGR